MKFLKRLAYLIYYIRETDFNQLGTVLRYTRDLTGRSRFNISADVLQSVFKYNISLKDYFCFRFFEKDKAERANWAGTGFMYEYQLIMNPASAREVLADKIQFLRYFKRYCIRRFLSMEEIVSDRSRLESMLNSSNARLVLKGSHGQVGAEVEVIDCKQYSIDSLINYMRKKKFDLVEEYVIQHSALMELSPSGLNTVRIFTQLHNGEVEFLGARLRVSVNSPVDNMAAGNLAAPVNIETGIVDGPGVFSDITKNEMSVHPVTGKRILGFTIPYWREVTSLAKEAALANPGNRSVGWDIAIKESGPELIEGNHNWCKLLWQLPVKRGLKSELEKYI